MRTEVQPANQIILTLEVVLGGIGQTGLAASTHFELQRLSDSKWLDLTTGLWILVPGGATNVLSEVDATNFPGFYEFVVPSTALTASDLVLGYDGYRFIVEETVNKPRENGMIVPGPVKGGVWEEADAAHFNADTMGNVLARMLRLRQSNMRFVPTAWDTVTRQPTVGEVLIYDDSVTLLADTGPGWALATGRYTVAATFDGSGHLTEYTSVKDA